MIFDVKQIENLISRLSQLEKASILAIKVNSSKRTGKNYASEEIILDRKEYVTEYLKDIKINHGQKEYVRVEPYSGDKNKESIYLLDIENPLIQEDYYKLLNAIVSSDHENEDIIFNGDALILQGELEDETNEYHSIKLLSYRRPYTILEHKYWLSTRSVQFGKKQTFQPIKDKIVSLPRKFDILIYDNLLYFLDLNGEKFFSLERSFRKICKAGIQKIIESNIIKDTDFFAAHAQKGFNPRRFLLFDERALEDLKNLEKRKKIAQIFNIKLSDDRFLIESDEDCTKLIKLLCQKGMLDPFTENAMEVSSAKKWDNK